MSTSPPPAGPPVAVPAFRSAASPRFRRLTFFSLLAGLCPLIPLPFLDDWTLEWVRRRLVVESFRDHGREASPRALQLLTWRPERNALAGCLRLAVIGPLLRLTVYLVRKVFRKIVFFLTLSDCVDRFSETFHEGYLLERAFELELVGDGSPAADERLWPVRWAVLAACRAVDPRPVRQIARRAFRGSRQALREAARLLARIARRKRSAAGGEPGSAAGDDSALVLEEERLLSGLLDRLTAALWHQEGYRAHLEAAFRSALVTPADGGSPQPAGPAGTA